MSANWNPLLRGTSTVIDEAVDVLLYVQPIGGMKTKSIDPICFGSRNGPFTIAASPMGNIFLDTNKNSSLGVPAMYKVIVSRDTVLVKALPNVGDVFCQPNVQFPNGRSNILQPTWTPK